MLKKVRLTVERSVYRQHASNRQHGSRLFASIHRVMPVSKRTCHFESESLISIAHFRKIMIAVWIFKTDHELWKTSAGVQYRSALQTGVCCFYLAAFASTPPRGCRAQQNTKAPALAAARAGAASLVRTQKNLCTEGSGVSNGEKLGRQQARTI
jgi:hypothetical protein